MFRGICLHLQLIMCVIVFNDLYCDRNWWCPVRDDYNDQEHEMSWVKF